MLDWLQNPSFGHLFDAFSLNSYGYSPQKRQKPDSKAEFFASIRRVRQTPRTNAIRIRNPYV